MQAILVWEKSATTITTNLGELPETFKPHGHGFQ
jgi:hypothetical protein